MLILALNCGSSTIKAEVIESGSGQSVARLQVDRMDSESPRLSIVGESDKVLPAASPEAVLHRVFDELLKRLPTGDLAAAAHRIVHGGAAFSAPIVIDESSEQAISEVSRFAPLHNPINLLGVRVARQRLPQIRHVAIFDTGFFHSLPKEAATYALPREVAKQHGLRRFGFHGISHEYVAIRAAAYLKRELNSLRLITCHLGNGCSVAAVENGTPVDTSMGFTPLEGLVMGTRPGDLDSGIVTMLLDANGGSSAELERILNRESGLKGLCGKSDMREIVAAADKGDSDCRLAIQVFCHRLTKYIGAYAAIMGGVDAIVFTGGIGENSPKIRQSSTARLGYLGADVDEIANYQLRLAPKYPEAAFSTTSSQVKLLAVATNEQLAMVRSAAQVVTG